MPTAPDTPPKWETVWSLTPETELWKAVALSLGLDPNSSNAFFWTKYPHEGDDDLSASEQEVRAEFQERLSVAVSNLPPAGGLPLNQSSVVSEGEDAPLTKVPLRKFAAFARHPLGWEVPEPMAKWAEEVGPKAFAEIPVKSKTVASSEVSNLLIVGALLRLLLPHRGNKQEAVIVEIDKAYPFVFGLSPSTLEKRFAEANKRFAEAKQLVDQAEKSAQQKIAAAEKELPPPTKKNS